jgi:hypothetical protein
MDSFETFDFDFTHSGCQGIPISAAAHTEEYDEMRQLVNADMQVGYGGYCIIA